MALQSYVEAYIDTPSGARIYAKKYPPLLRQPKTADTDIPILCVHDYLTLCEFDNFRPYLPSRTILSFHLEGYGKSSKPASLSELKHPILSLDTACSHLKAVLSHFGYNSPIDLFTYSMGACIAIRLALTSPDIKIRKLILAAPPDFSEPKELWLATAQQAKSQSIEDLLLYLLSSIGSRASVDVNLRETILQRLQAELSNNRDIMAQMWEASASIVDQCTSETPLSIAEQAWVFHGREDGQSDRHASEVAMWMTSAKLVALNAGHYFAWEDPETMGEELKKIFGS